MKARETKDITALFREGTSIDRALAAAVREAIRCHKQAGVPMAVWRNGKSVWVDPSELEGKPRNGRSKRRRTRGNR